MLTNNLHAQGEWSRLKYMQDARRNGASSIKEFTAVLPRSAHSLYFRDEIGNVSTSSVKRQREKLEVRLQPRFVLFGGWQVRPSSSALFRVSDIQNVPSLPNRAQCTACSTWRVGKAEHAVRFTDDAITEA